MLHQKTNTQTSGRETFTTGTGNFVRYKNYMMCKMESVDKPGSVADNHSSGTHVTVRLKRPTRIPCGPHDMTLQSTGFLFGLAPGGVFPATTVANRAVRSYRTISPLPACSNQFKDQPQKEEQAGGIFSVALSVGSHLPGVTWHPALWSPDFPPFVETKSDCLTDSVINSSRVLSQRPHIPMNKY
ncbi:hypothetical protein Lqua_1364 [Legionella quateirensis]|uniref:Uncharacterized protein n=1 Tax=Legionella quateirensis TaxID=45072 RepID=A0ABR5RNN3_9GAMM|nr:hypothetical protein Lqua_1364 [Legionella quateirensis]